MDAEVSVVFCQKSCLYRSFLYYLDWRELLRFLLLSNSLPSEELWEKKPKAIKDNNIPGWPLLILFCGHVSEISVYPCIVIDFF